LTMSHLLAAHCFHAMQRHHSGERRLLSRYPASRTTPSVMTCP